MIWSIIPEDTVFAGVGAFAAPGQGESAGASLRLEVGGCPCQVRQGAEGSLWVEAVCSTNPKDFLRPELQPGQRILSLK